MLWGRPHSQKVGLQTIRRRRARVHKFYPSRHWRYVGTRITQPRSFLHVHQAASPPGPPPDIVCRPPWHRRPKSPKWDADVPWGHGGHTYIYQYVRRRREAVEQSRQSDHESHSPPLCGERNAAHRPFTAGEWDLGGPNQRRTHVGKVELWFIASPKWRIKSRRPPRAEKITLGPMGPSTRSPTQKHQKPCRKCQLRSLMATSVHWPMHPPQRRISGRRWWEAMPISPPATPH